MDAACRAHGVTKIVAFGSRARGDATPASDLDIAVVFPRGLSLVPYMDAREALAQAFACPIGIIDFPRPSSRMRPAVDADGVVPYERRA